MAEGSIKKLSELIELANNFLKHNDYNKIEQCVSDMSVRFYLPMMEKIIGVTRVLSLNNYSDVESQEIKIAELYQNCFFYILLNQYAGVEIDDPELINFDNYDLLYPVFADEILGYCNKDYKMCMEYLHEVVNFYNIKDFMSLMEAINPVQLKEAAVANANVFNEIERNQELIKELKQIVAGTNPSIMATFDAVQNVEALKAKNQTNKE